MSTNSDSKTFSLQELAAAVGLPGRTIRFYIARELLPGPVKAGRDARYTAEHIKRIRAITDLQKKGLTLAEIGLNLHAGEPAGDAAPAPVSWAHHAISDDMVLMIRNDAAPWRIRHARRLLQELQRTLNTTETPEELS